MSPPKLIKTARATAKFTNIRSEKTAIDVDNFFDIVELHIFRLIHTSLLGGKNPSLEKKENS